MAAHPDRPVLPLLAGGQPLHPATATQAADWLTLLMSGEATAEDTRRWQQWRAADPDHERAWRHIEPVTGRLKALQPRAAYESLTPYATARRAPRGRRQATGLLLCCGIAGATGLLATRTQTWRQLAADHRTGTGEQRTFTLDDGTRLQLNTASAVALHFDAQRRRVRLVAGEMLVTTAQALGHAPDLRPFTVETAEGSVRPLGTRFTVRQWDARTSVGVLQGAVDIQPWSAAPQVVHAGTQVAFTHDAFGPPAAADAQATAWTRGQLLADDMRLDAFLVELGRYRTGIVRCDPAAAGLRLSGVFPLHDTERILATLPSVLPVQVRQRTRYWTMVEALPSS